jgi:hypothetical protein
MFRIFIGSCLLVRCRQLADASFFRREPHGNGTPTLGETRGETIDLLKLVL